jgi:hypothetical protein
MIQILAIFSQGLDLHLPRLSEEVRRNLEMLLKLPFWCLVGVHVCEHSNSTFIIRERECIGVVSITKERIFESLGFWNRNSSKKSRKLRKGFQELDSINEGIIDFHFINAWPPRF